MSKFLIGCAGAQGVLAFAVIGAVELVPPRHGEILLVSATGQARGDLVDLALQSQAALVGAGPIAGSLVVRGDRSAIAADALAQGVIPLAASRLICGDAA